MKRAFSALLIFVLWLSVSQPASAFETTFDDVPTGSWFEEGVVLCAAKGIMVGTGGGSFSPNTELTDAECLTLALRLYDLKRGGSGELLHAPEDWGQIILTLSDGTTITGYSEAQSAVRYGLRFQGNDQDEWSGAFVLAQGRTAEEQEVWALEHEGTASLSVFGTRYEGTVRSRLHEEGPCLIFYPDGDAVEGDPSNVIYSIYYTSRPGPDKWYRDVVYTAEQWGCDNRDGFAVLMGHLYNGEAKTNRELFAQTLAAAAGELEKKYDVKRLPDIQRPEYVTPYPYIPIYALYEAGILNGLDEYGTFGPNKALTRAEAATMVARVLEPTMRLNQGPTACGYEDEVMKLHDSMGYHDEKVFETEECTIFIYSLDGFTDAPAGAMKVIYKPGSQMGDGFVLELPHIRTGSAITPADTLSLSEDGKIFRYSYTFDIAGYSNYYSNNGISEPGTYTFEVDLPVGGVSQYYVPLSSTLHSRTSG